MGRFVTVTVQCDWALCEAVAAEGDDTIVEKTVSIDGKQAKAFLLCKNHLDDFERIVLPLMAAGIKVENGNSGGRKKSSSSTPPATVSANGTVTVSAGNGHRSETFECAVADCGRTLKNRTGLAQHVIRQHGFSDLAHYENIHGEAATTTT
jgi:hypothetical protein